MFPLKLKSRWSNSFMVQNIFPNRTFEVTHPDYDTFKVKGHQIKLYFGGSTDKEREEFCPKNRINCKREKESQA
ncbi:protein NYNRIN-like [Gossypium australe]|uniref:Protein NYNRIN-like n=1 Tax=Gossypium australe TaxID=47621 RepID=A0A5B6WZP3_9ROSI|nr:protein NYNRIN-like [Gossypium australe]